MLKSLIDMLKRFLVKHGVRTLDAIIDTVLLTACI